MEAWAEETQVSGSCLWSRRRDSSPGSDAGTYAEPDVHLVDLVDLAFGVERIGQLERRLERLALLLRGPST